MNQRYRLLMKGTFESMAKFEARLNEECALGWKAISIGGQGSILTVLLEREQKH